MAIKLIKNIAANTKSANKVMREIEILRRLSQLEYNPFTFKLLDIITPDIPETEIK